MITLSSKAKKEFGNLKSYTAPGSDLIPGGSLQGLESEQIQLWEERIRVVSAQLQADLEYGDIAKFYLPFEKASKRIVLEDFKGRQLPVTVEDPYAFHRFIVNVRRGLKAIPPLVTDHWGLPHGYDLMSVNEKMAHRAGEDFSHHD